MEEKTYTITVTYYDGISQQTIDTINKMITDRASNHIGHLIKEVTIKKTAS